MAGSLSENDVGLGLRALGVRTRFRAERSRPQGHDHCGCACGRSSECWEANTYLDNFYVQLEKMLKLKQVSVVLG